MISGLINYLGQAGVSLFNSALLLAEEISVGSIVLSKLCEVALLEDKVQTHHQGWVWLSKP